MGSLTRLYLGHHSSPGRYLQTTFSWDISQNESSYHANEILTSLSAGGNRAHAMPLPVTAAKGHCPNVQPIRQKRRNTVYDKQPQNKGTRLGYSRSHFTWHSRVSFPLPAKWGEMLPHSTGEDDCLLILFEAEGLTLKKLKSNFLLQGFRQCNTLFSNVLSFACKDAK